MKTSMIFSTIFLTMALSLGANAMHNQQKTKQVQKKACKTDQTSQDCKTDFCPTQTEPGHQVYCGDAEELSVAISTLHHNDADSDSSSSEDNQSSSCTKKTSIHLHRGSNLSGCSYKDQLLRTKHFHARKVTGMQIWSPKANCYKTVSHTQAKSMTKALKNNQASCVVNQGQEQYIDMNQWADQLY